MNSLKASALNTAPDSENQIHSDDLAKRYGFKGGLVPGVTVSAYLLHPVIESAGMDWLEKDMQLQNYIPLYDKENFEVILIFSEGQTNTFLKNEDGKIIAAETKI